jgi:hypothetical protein
MTMPKQISGAIARYHDTYRHPGLGPLELSGIYALFPGESSSVAIEYWWPAWWPNGNQPGVYLIFSTNMELLYVGMSGHLGSRLNCWFWWEAGPGSGCKVMHNWKNRPHYVATVALGRAFEALGLEGFLIEELNPPENTLGRGLQSSE